MSPELDPTDGHIVADAKDLIRRQVAFHDSQVERADRIGRAAMVAASALLLVTLYLFQQGIRPGPLTLSTFAVGSLGTGLALFALTALSPGGDPRHLVAQPSDVDRFAKNAPPEVQHPALTVCAFLVANNTRHVVRTSGAVRAAWLATLSAGWMAVLAIMLVALGAAHT